MFKRMSILLRRAEDSRPVFAEKWKNHGAFVEHLPLIRSYMQNHVLETFGDVQPIEADGIVELRFAKPEDMAAAFASPAATAVRDDEPGFLGHGTGYALTTDAPFLPAIDGSKLIVMIGDSSQPDALDAVVNYLRGKETCVKIERDEVGSVIARPEMARGPQLVSTFVQAKCANPLGASRLGSSLIAERRAELRQLRAVACRVRTITVI